MKLPNKLFDLENQNVIIYGAGVAGHSIYALINQILQNTKVIAFCDTFKHGLDIATGLTIIKPDELSMHGDTLIIIGISDVLYEEAVNNIELVLSKHGVSPTQIMRYSQFAKLFSSCDKEQFDWQKYADDVYDFNSNKLLIESIARTLDETDKSIVDLGAGSMALRNQINSCVKYYPVDFKVRCDETIICDFNKKEFPDIYADVYVLCAMLYYVEDPKWLIEMCAEYSCKKIIIALQNMNLGMYPEFAILGGYKNSMYFNEIEIILNEHKFFPKQDVTLVNVARRYVIYEKKIDLLC